MNDSVLNELKNLYWPIACLVETCTTAGTCERGAAEAIYRSVRADLERLVKELEARETQK